MFCIAVKKAMDLCLCLIQLSEGTKIEDGSELLLSCDRDYQPFGTTNIEEKIYCTQGEWDRYPICQPGKFQ